MSHTHRWQEDESFDSLTHYSCKCGAEMSIEYDQEGRRTMLFEPDGTEQGIVLK